MFKQGDAQALKAAFRAVIRLVDDATLRRDSFDEDALVPSGAGATAVDALINTGYSAAQIQTMKDTVQEAATKAGGGNVTPETTAKITQLLNYIPTLMGEA
jgi:hypothetical protein